MVRAAILIALILASTSALAGVEYQAYEGKEPIMDGQGGTRVSKHDIDYWTMGTPPRKFQIIGLITDVRKSGKLSGKTIGSETIAKKVKAAGGDAVIVYDASTQQAGVYSSGSAYATGNNVFGSGFSVPIVENTTRLLVVKYLP
jgi:hypothetical protein